MDSKELAQAVIQVLGPPAIGYDGKLPGEILNALSQLSEFSASQNPLKYLPSRAARQTIERWLKKAFPDEPYYVDILHDLGTMYSGLSAGLLSLRKVQEGDDIFTHMAKNPVLPITARIAGKETDFGGVLDRMVPEESLIVFDLASAAHATHDIGYVFGTGISERQCPFKDMFFELGENVLKPNAP